MIPARVDRVVLPVCLSLVGLSTAAFALLQKPNSWLSRWVDRKVDEAVTLPAPTPRRSR